MAVAGPISARIARLQKGVEVIGGGDLDHRIGSTKKDEVGALSRTFDRMAANLKEITASRDELNTEVAERERAEETLRHSKAESDRLLRNILPEAVADRLKPSTGIIADRFDEVTILFDERRLGLCSPNVRVFVTANSQYHFLVGAERYSPNRRRGL